MLNITRMGWCAFFGEGCLFCTPLKKRKKGENGIGSELKKPTFKTMVFFELNNPRKSRGGSYKMNMLLHTHLLKSCVILFCFAYLHQGSHD